MLALSGGIGGAKLALGLTQAMPPEKLMIVGNIGDDFVHCGLHISP
ncbi:MAG TPA: 2-phospho-L-lactate transferase, partial [Deltaproteobacteria bacterium]|nr:2-phospho-L-lactate transferase [Deltaproteobacteria bacterium]